MHATKTVPPSCNRELPRKNTARYKRKHPTSSLNSVGDSLKRGRFISSSVSLSAEQPSEGGDHLVQTSNDADTSLDVKKKRVSRKKKDDSAVGYRDLAMPRRHMHKKGRYAAMVRDKPYVPCTNEDETTSPRQNSPQPSSHVISPPLSPQVGENISVGSSVEIAMDCDNAGVGVGPMLPLQEQDHDPSEERIINDLVRYDMLQRQVSEDDDDDDDEIADEFMDEEIEEEEEDEGYPFQVDEDEINVVDDLVYNDKTNCQSFTDADKLRDLTRPITVRHCMCPRVSCTHYAHLHVDKYIDNDTPCIACLQCKYDHLDADEGEARNFNLDQPVLLSINNFMKHFHDQIYIPNSLRHVITPPDDEQYCVSSWLDFKRKAITATRCNVSSFNKLSCHDDNQLHLFSDNCLQTSGIQSSEYHSPPASINVVEISSQPMDLARNNHSESRHTSSYSSPNSSPYLCTTKTTGITNGSNFNASTRSSTRLRKRRQIHDGEI